ncbi:MAG: single-stranded DNA-binding protein [Candidatus Eisenbacteria bacterium]|uniref:Single-stranded DNA-binding protein n=1 Tax=Eiseniibacteriota bacterium TaxID=2212470 RepID=A0A849SHE6_UNCEI|nr:single-stranded DNA-binding protein [Candidatus Eisenbacteria bacterium]
MDLNKVTLIGNVVRDPESRVSASGDGSQRLCRFSLATNYAWQDAKTKARREAVDFHDCIAWGKLGEIIAQYVRKGSKVYVEGRLRKRPYVNADGQRRMANEIVADNMIMLGHRAKAPSTVNATLVSDSVDGNGVEEGA